MRAPRINAHGRSLPLAVSYGSVALMMALRGQEPHQQVEQLLHMHSPCKEVEQVAWEVIAADDSDDPESSERSAHDAALMVLRASAAR